MDTNKTLPALPIQPTYTLLITEDQRVMLTEALGALKYCISDGVMTNAYNRRKHNKADKLQEALFTLQQNSLNLVAAT